MIVIRNIKIPVESKKEQLDKKITNILRLKEVPDYEILKRSIDARKKPDIFYVYHIGVSLENNEMEKQVVNHVNNNNVMLTSRNDYQLPNTDNDASKVRSIMHHPLIIGAGPAGLFCGYILAKCGYDPVIVERGSKVEERVNIVNDFWNGKGLNPECNVQFGEGGAGTFSDGKLNTQVKDKYGRINFILKVFVKHGADPSILYDSKPHIGTDVLFNVISGMRKEIKELGGTFLFDTKASQLLIGNNDEYNIENINYSNNITNKNSNENNNERTNENPIDNSNVNNVISNKNIIAHKKMIKSVCLTQNGLDTWVDTNHVVLAIGHSARDTFSMLYDMNVPMVSKDFAMGVRIEHPESMIRRALYGDGKAAGMLPTPPYKLTYQTASGRGVYSFCMCPGGYVVNASSEDGYTAVNGMSYSGRNGANSNSALIVTVRREDYSSDSPLAGVELQRELEKRVFEQGNGKIVVQRYADFKAGVKTDKLGDIIPQTKGEYICGNVASCLPDYITESIVEAMPAFNKDINGFENDDAIISGVESRTSSPVRILRGKDFQSEDIQGLYPCGEGAGYAGGIMSAAIDGMKVAEAIIHSYTPLN